MSDPWMKFYPSDWLAGTRGLKLEEAGLYITLVAAMCEDWAPIARNDARLSRFCNCSQAKFRKLLDGLIEMEKIIESNGELTAPASINQQTRGERTPLSRSLRLCIFERDMGVCAYCFEQLTPETFHVDHILPFTLGGSDSPANLCIACPACNLSKGVKTLDEWVGDAACAPCNHSKHDKLLEDWLG